MCIPADSQSAPCDTETKSVLRVEYQVIKVMYTNAKDNAT